MRKAEALVADLRRELTQEIARRGRQLRKALQDQTRLGKRLTSRKIDPAGANAQNRKIEAAISEFRAAIRELNAVLSAQSSGDLGGLVDRPIAEYAKLVKGPPPKIDLAPTPLGFGLWLVCMAAAILGVLFYLGAIHLTPPVRLDVSTPNPQTGMVQVTCHNNGRRPILVYIPWPAEQPSGTQNIPASDTYGIRVEVRERGSTEYHPAPCPPEAWTYQRMRLRENAALTVGPALSLTIQMDPDGLKEVVGSPDSIRLALQRTTGRTVRARMVDLPANVEPAPASR